MKNICLCLVLGVLLFSSCSNEEDVILKEKNNSEQAAVKPDDYPVTTSPGDCPMCGITPETLVANIYLKVGEYRTIGGVNGDKVEWVKYPYSGAVFIASGANATVMFPRPGNHEIHAFGYVWVRGYDQQGNKCYCVKYIYKFYITVTGSSEPSKDA
ncbi:MULTISPECIES: hypothetical protein [Dysgonomonas]|uniref:hypothetical protein n=1 Tax=Dysgonomonas TaxID=156973 RepID=UPI000925B494|nr:MULTISPECIES: hypothetical protein [Dysgonomonas]MBN9301164.1 hypothetical protein [Dysgonomonas mossii]OJX59193.1 MAG: hypothetical protein BGO84_16755 [Dysgonomonas sp. 37-18]